MKKYLWMSSAAVVIAALRVNISSQKKMYVVTPQLFCQHMCIQILYLLPFHLHLLDAFNPLYTSGLFHYIYVRRVHLSFQGVGSIFVIFILFLMENPVCK